MTSFTIEVKDKPVQAALKALAARVKNTNPVLRTIGEGIVDRTKRRFDTSTDPAGQPWKPNSAVTLSMLAGRLSGQKSKTKKNGDLNAAGLRAYFNKKPLIGESEQLKTQFHHQVISDSLTVSTTSVTAAYAAIQQFGGKAGRGKKVTIPARPFLPIRQDGTLYPADQAEILKSINAYLMGDL
jgi:phage gpG-like protein